MKSKFTLSKILAVLALISASIWLGSYLSRLFIVYQFFEGPDLILKNYINENNIDGILFSVLPAIIVHFVSFIIMMITTILFYLTTRLSLRFNGWLFIILIAVLILLPFEIYLMSIDYNIILTLNSRAFDSTQVVTMLRDRITDLSSFSIVVLLTYSSFYYFIVFQPLTKNVDQKL